MIVLNVEEYCHNCPDFEAYVERDICNFDIVLSASNMKCNHIITCEHEDRCRQIKKYLEEEVKNE
jgi:hypothetical protein